MSTTICVWVCEVLLAAFWCCSHFSFSPHFCVSLICAFVIAGCVLCDVCTLYAHVRVQNLILIRSLLNIYRVHDQIDGANTNISFVVCMCDHILFIFGDADVFVFVCFSGFFAVVAGSCSFSIQFVCVQMPYVLAVLLLLLLSLLQQCFASVGWHLP